MFKRKAKNAQRKTKGYTLPELLLTMSVAMILIILGTLSFANLRNDSHLDLVASQVSADLDLARLRAENDIPAGVYFETGRFVYFESATYSEGDPSNRETALPSSMAFSSITFTNQIAQFDGVSGYPENYVDPSEVILTQSFSGKTRTIEVSRWGIVSIQ